MFTLAQPELSFPNVVQLGGQMQALVSLARAEPSTYADAVNDALEVFEFYDGDRSVISRMPSKFDEVGPFANRLFGTLRRPLTKSLVVLADHPAPCRVRAEGIRDDVVFDCADNGIIPLRVANMLVGSASVYMFVTNTNYMGYPRLGLKQKIELSRKMWLDSIGSDLEKDLAISMLVEYGIPRPKEAVEKAHFKGALRHAVETDILRRAINDLGKGGPVLGDVRPSRLRSMRDAGILTKQTYDSIEDLVRYGAGGRERETLKLNSGSQWPDLTHTDRAELELIHRMHLAMKVWVGNIKFAEKEQSQVDALLMAYGIPSTSRSGGSGSASGTDRIRFLDSLRGAVEADMLREIINDAGVVQFIRPRLLNTMYDMGMLTRQTFNTVSEAIERRRNAIHTRDTMELDVVPIIDID